jgi:hypothetical protein
MGGERTFNQIGQVGYLCFVFAAEIGQGVAGTRESVWKAHGFSFRWLLMDLCTGGFYLG